MQAGKVSLAIVSRPCLPGERKLLKSSHLCSKKKTRTEKRNSVFKNRALIPRFFTGLGRRDRMKAKGFISSGASTENFNAGDVYWDIRGIRMFTRKSSQTIHHRCLS